MSTHTSHLKISLIIPAFNEEDFIGQCLDSVMKQTVAPDEVIVVDNNSTDNTAKIAGGYRGVRVVHEEVQGMIPARNRGFNEAKFDIIARCDSDCILPPDWIERIKNDFAENSEIDGLTGAANFYDFPIRNVRPIIENSMEQMKRAIGHYSYIGPNMVITKKIWKKVEPLVCFEEKIVHEDVDLSIHLNDVGGNLMYDNDLVVDISARRLKKKPFEFLFEYPYRVVKTIQHHKKEVTSSEL